MTQHDEQQIVSAIRSGDKAAFTRLVHAYERLVLHIVAPLVENEHDRADVCQDVFIKVHEQLHRFQFRAKLATWIGQIAYNTTLNFLRRRRPLLVTALTGLGSGDGEADQERYETGFMTDSGQRPDSLLIRKESEILLRDAVGRLPPLQQAVLRLFHADELPLDDIASILSMPVNTVKSHLFRARKSLKQILLAQQFNQP